MKSVYRLRKIGFSYNGYPVLDIADLEIGNATLTAVVGPNGSGKTTLLNILAFLDFPEQGDIRFFDQAVDRGNYRDFRRRIGFVQQKPYLFRTTVTGNIEMGLKIRKTGKAESRRRVDEMLHRFNLSGFERRLPNELSGGEAQKVAIARTLVLEPEVLILDEPFNHLDSSFRADLENLIRSIVKDGAVTLIFTTHDQLHAQVMADRILSLMDGRLTPLPAINLFRGVLREDVFETGKIRISVPPDSPARTMLAIDANQIVLSKHELESSMRNRFYGRVTGVKEQGGAIDVAVWAGETFHAVITPTSLRELEIHPGDQIWVSFKSTAVQLF
jgi:molybdopterin-binding protein